MPTRGIYSDVTLPYLTLRHQFIHLFDNISEGDIKGFVFQHNSEVYIFISAAFDFLIDLFVGTYRLSSHARLEAFVIQLNFGLLYLSFVCFWFELLVGRFCYFLVCFIIVLPLVCFYSFWAFLSLFSFL